MYESDLQNNGTVPSTNIVLTDPIPNDYNIYSK
ncbi:hypothetical protein ACT7DA_04540 [Bacillus pacificus]